MGFRFEFEPVHKILLCRFEGRLTDKSLGEFYRAGLKHWAATDARAAISDYTSAEWAVSAEFVRELANWEPAVTEPAQASSHCRGPKHGRIWSGAHVSDRGRA